MKCCFTAAISFFPSLSFPFFNEGEGFRSCLKYLCGQTAERQSNPLPLGIRKAARDKVTGARSVIQSASKLLMRKKNIGFSQRKDREEGPTRGGTPSSLREKKKIRVFLLPFFSHFIFL